MAFFYNVDKHFQYDKEGDREGARSFSSSLAIIYTFDLINDE